MNTCLFFCDSDHAVKVWPISTALVCKIFANVMVFMELFFQVFSGITLTKFGGIIVLAFSSSQIFEVVMYYVKDVIFYTWSLLHLHK